MQSIKLGEDLQLTEEKAKGVLIGEAAVCKDKLLYYLQTKEKSV